MLLEAVLYRYRAGVPWRDGPERFGDGKNVQQRWNRWAASGALENLFKPLAADADHEYALIDSTFVRSPSTQRWRSKKTVKTRLSGEAKAD